MTQARGYKETVNLIKESTFGVTPSITPGDMVTMPINTNDLKSSQNQIDPETLRGNRAQVVSGRGNIAVSGNLVVPVDVRYIGHWLELVFGAASTTGAGPYDHEFSMVDTLPSASLDAFFATPAHASLFKGCKANTFSMEVGGDGELVASIGLMGASETVGTSAADSGPSTYSFERFNNFQATIKEGGSTISNLISASFEINNSLDPNYCIGGAGAVYNMPEGTIMINGNLVALFETQDLYNKAINGTESSVQITLTNGSHILDFLFPEVTFQRDGLQRNGGGGVMVNLPFRAYYDNASEASPYVVTLTNDVSGY